MITALRRRLVHNSARSCDRVPRDMYGGSDIPMNPQIISMDVVQPKPGEKGVTIRRLVWDWGDTSRLPLVERQRILGHRLPGCWFLNPQYEVHGRFVAPGFFLSARKCQADWFRILDRQFPDGGWRNVMSTTTDLERQGAFTGILIVNGRECDAHDWNTIEELGGLRPRVQRRPAAFQMVRQQDWPRLIQMSRSHLEGEIAADPEMALFVTPGITVAGLPLRPFYREVHKRSSEWHGFVTRVLGSQRRAKFTRNADWATRMLTVSGTLVIDGMIYVPGLWPGQSLTKRKMAASPFGTTTVPPEYLGLQLTVPENPVGVFPSD